MAFDYSTALHVVYPGVSPLPMSVNDDGDFVDVVVPKGNLSVARTDRTPEKQLTIVTDVDAALKAVRSNARNAAFGERS